MNNKYQKAFENHIEEGGLEGHLDDYETRGKRGEARSIIKILGKWINTPDADKRFNELGGDKLTKVYSSASALHAALGYPEPGDIDDDIGHDFSDDEMRDPPPRETDQDRYGYQGDR
jgi:hypothetical protein